MGDYFFFLAENYVNSVYQNIIDKDLIFVFGFFLS